MGKFLKILFLVLYLSIMITIVVLASLSLADVITFVDKESAKSGIVVGVLSGVLILPAVLDRDGG